LLRPLHSLTPPHPIPSPFLVRSSMLSTCFRSPTRLLHSAP
jgi:hypothetical protein